MNSWVGSIIEIAVDLSIRDRADEGEDNGGGDDDGMIADDDDDTGDDDEH